MKKYLIPPLISSFSFWGILSIASVILEFDKSGIEVIGQIYFTLVLTLITYPMVLIIHLLGCMFIAFMKANDAYSLTGLLVAGFVFGILATTIDGKAIYPYSIDFIAGGLAGMIAGWSYYCIDKKNKNIKTE